MQRLKEKVDTLIVIPNDRLLTVANDKTSVLNAFKMADEVLLQGVSGITNLITTPGLINTDFADVKMVLSQAGSALMGIGQASGDDRAVSAAKAAISSPLLESAIDGARGVLLNITGPSSMGLFEMNAAAEIIHGVAHPDANIIFGTVIDDEMGDEVKVTVIAAGFDRLDGAPVGISSAKAADDASPSCSPRTSPIRSTRRRRRLRRPVVPALTDVAANLARRSDRGSATGVDILAVTKGFGPDAVVAARRRRLPGDRRELRPGAGRQGAAWRAAAGVAVHFIGQLQTNKVRQLAGLVDVWETVDRPRLVAELARRAPGAHVLVQVDTTGEAGKGGCPIAAVPALVRTAVDAGLDRRRADDRRPDRGWPRGRASRFPGRAGAGRRARPDDVLDGDDRRPRGRRRGGHHRRSASAPPCSAPALHADPIRGFRAELPARNPRMADQPRRAVSSSPSMTSFVLLPGAGSDSWYWHRVIPLLEAAGHEALAVDLPVDDDTAGLDRYVDVAVAAVEAVLPDRQDLVVVAQSMGAFTAPLLVGRVPVAELVLVVPMIAAPHERLGDWWDSTNLAQARQEAEAAGGPAADDWDPERMFLHDVPPEVAAASGDHVTEQSDRPSQDVWPLDAWPYIPTRVVVARDDRLFPLAFQRRLAQERLGIVPDELPGGHLPALARPDELVSYLLS